MSDTLESNKKHFSFKVTHVDKNSGARAGEIKTWLDQGIVLLLEKSILFIYLIKVLTLQYQDHLN